MAHVAGLRIHPVKSLDGVSVDAADLTPGGTLAGDREFALFGPDGEPVNGKRTDKVHRLRADYDPSSGTLTVQAEAETEPTALNLLDNAERVEAWFSEFFGLPVTLRRNADGGFPDRPGAGPSVVSTASLEAVASWFDELTVDGVRRRLRANVEIGGVPAFWEDQFVGENAPRFVVDSAAGPVRFDGVEPCGRCVVPTRDPTTGDPTPEFRERFIERRAATFPEFADRDAFPHDYTLMLIAQVPEADRDGTLRVGDEVRVVDGEG